MKTSITELSRVAKTPREVARHHVHVSCRGCGMAGDGVQRVWARDNSSRTASCIDPPNEGWGIRIIGGEKVFYCQTCRLKLADGAVRLTPGGSLQEC